MRLIRKLPTLLWATPLVLIITVILIPVFIAMLILGLPFILFDAARKPKRIASLRNSIQSKWLPNKKYIYLDYDEGTPLSELLEKAVLPKYGKYIVADTWSGKKRQWSYEQKEQYEQDSNIIHRDIITDYDAQWDFHLVGISSETRFFHEDSSEQLFLAIDHDTKEIQKHAAEGGSLTSKQAQKMIEDKIKQILAAWNLKI